MLLKIYATSFNFKCSDFCDSLNAALPIFEQRFNVTRFARSSHIRKLEAQNDIDSDRAGHYKGQCDEMFAASDIQANGFNYHVNVEYDFKNKIWKSLGFYIGKVDGLLDLNYIV